MFEPTKDTAGDRAKEFRSVIASANELPKVEQSQGTEDGIDLQDKRIHRNAASVLMKVMYGARMARYALLRAINTLAKRLTFWDEECDKRLYRLMCYIWSTRFS